jgi:hypothetical protein
MQYLALALLVLSPLALAGCHDGGNPVATVQYTQVGACTQADFPNGRITAQPSQAIVIFNVNFVDNTAVNQTWSLDSANFRVTPLSSQQTNLGSTGPVTIPAHQPVPLNSYVDIRRRNRETGRLRCSSNRPFPALRSTRQLAGSWHDRSKRVLDPNLIPVRPGLQFDTLP